HGGVAAVFSRFDAAPVAAASLAQVHRATLRADGAHVAVKVQFPGLEPLIRSDLLTIDVLARVASALFPLFDMRWAVRQFDANLRRELDYSVEAACAARTAALFGEHERVRVPRVYAQLSTARLLVMQWVDGFRADDVARLRDAHIDAALVAHTAVDAFAQMTFVHGFVHCDPHAGNLMVLPNATRRGAFELYLLDHGLYRELPDAFRHSYCRLWRALVLGDARGVERACVQLRAPQLPPDVLSIALLNRAWTREHGGEQDGHLRGERLEAARRHATAVALRHSRALRHVPDELLLLLKTDALLRSVAAALHVRVNRLKLYARYAVRGLR
ncbi:unnamed protein product, partial [Agarophyton chilense]